MAQRLLGVMGQWDGASISSLIVFLLKHTLPSILLLQKTKPYFGSILFPLFCCHNIKYDDVILTCAPCLTPNDQET